MTFRQFAKFPAEIRVVVWHHAAQIPRIIGVDYKLRWDFKGNRMRCPLLLVNWEARIEALNYKKDLNDGGVRKQLRTLDVAPNSSVPGPIILANPDIDIIWLRNNEKQVYIGYSDLRDRMWVGCWQPVRRLAMDYYLYTYIFHVTKHFCAEFDTACLFDLSLEEMVLLFSEGSVKKSDMENMADTEMLLMSGMKDKAQAYYEKRVEGTY